MFHGATCLRKVNKSPNKSKASNVTHMFWFGISVTHQRGFAYFIWDSEADTPHTQYMFHCIDWLHSVFWLFLSCHYPFDRLGSYHQHTLLMWGLFICGNLLNSPFFLWHRIKRLMVSHKLPDKDCDTTISSCFNKMRMSHWDKPTCF